MAAMNDPLAAPAKARPPSATSRARARPNRHVLVVIVNNRPGCPQPRRQPRARAQLQHRVAGGRPHRAARHQPHDHHPARRRLRRRADGQAALPADRRAQGPGPARRASVVEHELALIKVRATNHKRGRDAAHHRAVQGPRPRRRRPIPSSSSTAAPSRRSTRSSRCWAASASGRWCAPVPSPWPAAPAPSTSRASCEPGPCRRRARVTHRHVTAPRGGKPDARTHVLRQRRRPAGARRPDRRHHRLRQPGPRPRPEPPRQRASTSSSGLAPG